MTSESKTISKDCCYHCGEECIESEKIFFDEKEFCCEGCKMVYGILNENDLCNYYELDKNPGITQRIKVRKDKFAFLDSQETANKLIIFSKGNQVHVKFYLPQIHCSSCIWLLEFMHKLNAGILESRADFTRKECTVIFDKSKTSIRKIAELLTSIGYEPHISFGDISVSKSEFFNRSLLYRLGIAGFCFGNIMMLSFPEYFGLILENSDKGFRVFSYVNLFLGTFVFVTSAREFFVSAWKGIAQKHLNIDAPVALAILITYFRSVYDILTQSSPGYMDSMTGIVFFMLIGRFYQDYSQKKLSFDRDFKSFFPAAVNKIENDKEIPTTIDKLREGDIIKIHHSELIPADGILLLGQAKIDYSFVTGESEPQYQSIGELVYAGGRQTAQSIQLKLTRQVSQSYLTSLWEQNKGNFDQKKTSVVHAIAKNFTLILFAFVALTALYWAIFDASKIFNTVTAMLIIACPCALLLAVTFTNGTVLGILSMNGLFLRNPIVLESLSEADVIIFDKTGTITQSGESEIQYVGENLSTESKLALLSLCSQSLHPLSRSLSVFLRNELEKEGNAKKLSQFKNQHFEELTGLGIKGTVNGLDILMGSAAFLKLTDENAKNSNVHISIEGEYLGYFSFKNQYRFGLQEMLNKLQDKFNLALLSGDKPSEKNTLSKMFPSGSQLHFEQMPEDKKNFISRLQAKGHKTIMVGDGLNDAIALAQSNAGIAVTDDTNLFSPACDGILIGKNVTKLPSLLALAKANSKIIYFSFAVSLIYNSIGLFFAVQGLLSPLIAAIIMPSMTISIVIISTVSGRLIAKKNGLQL